MSDIIQMHCSHKVSEIGNLIRYVISAYYYENGGIEISTYRQTYPIVRRTQKCDVIDEYGNEKFVLRDSRKRYAYPTDELAIESLGKRVYWSERYALNQLNRAQAVYQKYVELFRNNSLKEK